MEKLLQLLNEYLGQTNIVVIEQEIEGRRDIFFENEDGFHVEEAEIISKKFGFIQWLYDEQKIIDDNKMGEVNIIELEDKASGIITDYSLTSENVLMLLAIQDDPTNFLVSLLK